MPGGQNAMAHLKKRKLEAESMPKTMQHTSPLNGKKQQLNNAQDMELSDAALKRRRKSVRDDDISMRKQSESDKTMLPQKKRVFGSSNSGSPARKAIKNSEEPEDDETLIRETEAALKSLSGSWPGPSGGLYQRGVSDEDRYESNFENLFEEKKDAPKLSPCSVSTSSTTSNEAGCSLKDVITFRGQDRRSFQQMRPQQLKTKKDMDVMKMEADCPVPNNLKSRALKDRIERLPNEKYSRYDPPDFNELVDDSSNELEIDMSDPLADKEDERDQRSEDKCKDRKGKTPSSSPSGRHLFSPSSSTTYSSSAFRPPNTDHGKACRTPSATTSSPPIGPYPASATFVGFPTPVPGPVMPVPQPVIPPSSEEKNNSVSLLQLKSPKEEQHQSQSVAKLAPSKPPAPGLPPAASPDINTSKQYTILQPAGLGSRAASAIQDITREGVVSVTAVSSSSGSNSSTSSYASSKNGSNGGVNGCTASCVTTNTTTTTTTAVGDISTTTGGQEVMKIQERNFDGNRPGMSMSPSSIGRGDQSFLFN